MSAPALDAIPDWLLLSLGVLADVAVLYGGIRLAGRVRRRWKSRRDGAP